MIHEMSIQTARPGHQPALAKLFAEQGLAVRRRHGGVFRGAWTSEFGALNKVYSLWEHEDATRQQQAAQELQASPGWRAYTDAAGPLLAGAEVLLLSPHRAITRAPDEGKIYDFRIYDIKPYFADEYARLLADVLPVREKYSKNFCIWTPAAGLVHRVVHLWPYEGLEQRIAVRAGIAAQPEWKEFIGKVFPLLVAQRSSLLRPIANLAQS